ncbi:MAG: hypothetical protein QNJ88_03110 [Acidimicrobiia bacterium]|nr:hypothetical protein [Acidimicrobiia bacterium]
MGDADPVGPDGAMANSAEEEPPWPVGFLILVGLAALYLGWRLIQLIVTAVGWVF